MGDVREFVRPSGPPTVRMVRVVDITSPFFSWEGALVNAMPIDADGKQYIQIQCAHNGFQFPLLTFATVQVVELTTTKW